MHIFSHDFSSLCTEQASTTYERSESIWRLDCIHWRLTRPPALSLCSCLCVQACVCVIVYEWWTAFWIHSTLPFIDRCSFLSIYSYTFLFAFVCAGACVSSPSLSYVFFLSECICLFARLRFLTILLHMDTHIHFNPKLLFWSRPFFIPTVSFFRSFIRFRSHFFLWISLVCLAFPLWTTLK